MSFEFQHLMKSQNVKQSSATVPLHVKLILKTFTQISKRYECTLNEYIYFFCPSETAIAISHFAIVAHFNSSYNTRNRWRSFCNIAQLRDCDELISM